MQQLIDLILSLFSPKVKAESTPAKRSAEITPPSKEVAKVEINWLDPKAKVSKYFTVKEVLYLPSWKCLHNPTEEEKQNIIKMAEKMDTVREFINKSVNIHCWLRPGKVNCPTFDPKSVKIDSKDPKREAKEKALAALDYNAFVGGASRSAHKLALAVDFDCNENCDDTRKKLEPKLEEYNMRMEQMPGGTWVHLDLHDKSVSGGIRFFKP